MNNKWYISALVIILAFLGGITSHEKSVTPNQEIVLQFSSETVSNDEAQIAITTVKQQLETVGVHDIQVTEYKGGQLKITYFSTIDIGSVKKLLSKEVSLGVSDAIINSSDIPFEIPSKENSIAYNVDVYEIQNGYDTAFHLSGKLALEHKADHDRLSNTNPFAHAKPVDCNIVEQQVKVAYKFHKHSGIAINHISHKIPEVRAGPDSIGIFHIS
ncbi:MAG: hypothetical protein GYB32_13870 [Algicola sp.]|nr:hypothetical protein [Algicola sp.]